MKNTRYTNYSGEHEDLWVTIINVVGICAVVLIMWALMWILS